MSASVGVGWENRLFLIYDRSAHKWINSPAGYRSVSPDGAVIIDIARAKNGTDVYRIEALTGARHHIGSIPGLVIGLIGLRPEGMYVQAIFNDPHTTQPGVYRFELDTGRTIRIGPTGPDPLAIEGLWFWVTSAAVWRSLNGPNQGGGIPVDAISLSDGRLTTWYTAPSGDTATIVGFVKPDEPLVAQYVTGPYDAQHSQLRDLQYMVLTGPNMVQRVSMDPSINTSGGSQDAFGVWLSAPGRLWLYDTAGLIPMVDLLKTPLASESPALGGQCL